MSESKDIENLDLLMEKLRDRMEFMNSIADKTTSNILKVSKELDAISGTLESLNYAISQLEIDLFKELRHK